MPSIGKHHNCTSVKLAATKLGLSLTFGKHELYLCITQSHLLQLDRIALDTRQALRNCVRTDTLLFAASVRAITSRMPRSTYIAVVTVELMTRWRGPRRGAQQSVVGDPLERELTRGPRNRTYMDTVTPAAARTEK